MRFHHLRNATALLTLGERCVLVDPMLCDAGAFGGLKFFGGGRRPNPLVPLPEGALEAMERATDVVITHEHPDHLDRRAIRWIVKRGLPVWCSPVDVANLGSKGLDARALADGAMGCAVERVPAAHGRGLMGWLMGPVSGFYLAHPDEPSVYITGDAVMTERVRDALDRLRPEVVIAPAGAANFGVGPSILFPEDELVEIARRAPGDVIFNHLEALDHCPTTRSGLRARLDAEGLGDRAYLPSDGEALVFERASDAPHVAPGPSPEVRPGFQKWLTAKFTMT